VRGFIKFWLLHSSAYRVTAGDAD